MAVQGIVMGLGLIASILVSIAYVPQVIKTVKTKKTRDFSLLWISILASGLFLYTVYGILVRDIPVILSSSFGFALTATLLAYKIRYK